MTYDEKLKKILTSGWKTEKIIEQLQKLIEQRTNVNKNKKEN